VHKELVVPAMSGAPAEPHAFTPSSAVISPDDTLYVSSVFTGTIAEFTKGGRWVRDLYPLSPVTVPSGPTGNTPFGLAITADGSLWIADLGIALVVPGPGLGSVIRLRFNGDRNPVPPGDTINDGLDFPDGLGVYTPRA
jgi:streptogramin lyase